MFQVKLVIVTKYLARAMITDSYNSGFEIKNAVIGIFLGAFQKVAQTGENTQRGHPDKTPEGRMGSQLPA